MEKAKKPYKNRFLWPLPCKNVKNKKWILSKNCLTLFVSGREKNAHFRAHYLFWPKMFFGPKQCKPGTHYNNSGFSGNCPKPKMTPCL